jgi:hypothetical protein
MLAVPAVPVSQERVPEGVKSFSQDGLLFFRKRGVDEIRL